MSFALADGLDAQHSVSSEPNEISLIGGGAKSGYWRQMLADISGMKLVGTEVGVTVQDVCPVPELVQTHLPDESKKELYQAKRKVFQALYTQVKDLF